MNQRLKSLTVLYVYGMKSRNFILRITYSLILLLIILTSFTKKLHPFYVSVTEINVDTQKKSISLSCKMFTDDLQNTLYKIYKVPVDLSKKRSLNDSLVSRYVKERIIISLENKSINLKYIGYEIEEEAVWCYFESALTSEDKMIRVTHSILYDFLKSQSNFLHCYYNGYRKSFKLDNPEQSAVFSF